MRSEIDLLGTSSGLAIMISGILQGQCAASGIYASAKKPEVFGKCFAALGVVETFALFAFVFLLLIM